MDLRLKGKVVLVTGGAKGIGAAIVRGCCAEGATPVIVDRDEQAGEQLQAELRTNRAETGLIIAEDRKSTRLNSSHDQISYAVFCLKKKKKRYTSRPVDRDIK